MREGRGAGAAGALPPPTPALHYIFSTTRKNFVQVMPHGKEGSDSPCIPDEAPQPPPPSGTLFPAARQAAPRYGAAALGYRPWLWVTVPAAVSQQGRHRRAPAQWGPSPSYLLSRQAIHSAEEEEWAACAATMLGSSMRVPGRSDLPRSLCLCLARRADRSSRPASQPATRAAATAGSGPAELGGRRGPEGRDVGTGRALASCRCSAEPGGGESSGPAHRGEGARW